jgi:protein TonB
MAEWHRGVDLRINRQARLLGRLSVRGQTIIGLRIDRGGRLIESRVLRSSGETELDGAFLAVVRTAAPFPPLPATYSGSVLSFATTMTSDTRKGDRHGMRPLRPYPADY